MGKAVDRLTAKLAGPAEEARDDHGRWTAGGAVAAIKDRLAGRPRASGSLDSRKLKRGDNVIVTTKSGKVHAGSVFYDAKETGDHVALMDNLAYEKGVDQGLGWGSSATAQQAMRYIPHNDIWKVEPHRDFQSEPRGPRAEAPRPSSKSPAYVANPWWQNI